MSRSGLCAAAWTAVILVAAALQSAAGTTPTPTPSPVTRGNTSLARYADRAPLRASPLQRGEDGGIVITNDTVLELREGGSVTTVSGPGARPDSPSTTPSPRAARRAYWRRSVDAQRRRIAAAADELAKADARVRALEDAALTGGRGAVKRWAKVDEAKRRRLVIARHLQREREALGAVIRAARREGAEPGWFR